MSRSSVRIREVGPREGLQVINEPIPTEAKVHLIQDLVRCGAREINVTSLVNPRTVPQMADADALLDQLSPEEGVTFSVLTPNPRALQRVERHARSGLVQEVLIIHAVSASLLAANGVGTSVKENEKSVLGLAAIAKAQGLATSIFVSAAFGCSIEGEMSPDDVVDAAFSLAANDAVDEVIISDSTGQANPWQVSSLLNRIASEGWGARRLGLHLHDTRGAGLANAVAAIESDIVDLSLDCSFGGWGGDVPFLPEASGNIATEDVVIMLDGMGVRTGIDAAALIKTAVAFSELVNVPLQSRTPEVGPVKWRQAPAGVG